MRELPYLVVLVRAIKEEICYAYIEKVVAYDKQYEELSYLEGQKIIDIPRYGFYIQFQMSIDTMLVDLGDEASLVCTEDDEYPDALIGFFTDKTNFFIVDPKKTTTILPVWKDITTMPQVGYDPLTKQFNYNIFCMLLEKYNMTIEELIKDQTIIAGIGDQYAKEILSRVEMDKSTKTGKINKTKAKEVYLTIKKVLREAINVPDEEVESDDF